MIPKVGDKVRVNPVFLRQYGICKGIGPPDKGNQADCRTVAEHLGDEDV
jgi:hypothetical protein